MLMIICLAVLTLLCGYNFYEALTFKRPKYWVRVWGVMSAICAAACGLVIGGLWFS